MIPITTFSKRTFTQIDRDLFQPIYENLESRFKEILLKQQKIVGIPIQVTQGTINCQRLLVNSLDKSLQPEYQQYLDDLDRLDKDRKFVMFYLNLLASQVKNKSELSYYLPEQYLPEDTIKFCSSGEKSYFLDKEKFLNIINFYKVLIKL